MTELWSVLSLAKCARRACQQTGIHPHRDLKGLYCSDCAHRINDVNAERLVDTTRVGNALGLAAFNTVSDFWSDATYENHAAFREQRLLGYTTCIKPPTVEEPHRLRTVEVRYRAQTGSLLYCPTCRCIVPPPCEEGGYTYAEEYPEEWRRFVDPWPVHP